MQLLSGKVKFSSCAIALLLLRFSAGTFYAEAPPAGGNAESLAAAEQAFAREALEHGTRAAFLHALSDDGIVFLPGPQNGRKAWRAQPPNDGVLEWAPVLAAVATSGDLGFTTGPWTFRKSRGEAAPTAYGQFVSLWRWKNGEWKLLFDLGSENPMPVGPTPELQLVVNHAPNESAADALPVMLAHDRRYAGDRAAQLNASAEEKVRLYLPKQFPIIGRSAAVAALRQEMGPLRFAEAKGEVSRAGDLGYAWGEYRAGEAAVATGDYLRIWRKDRAGGWKLALDLVHPR